MGRCVHEADEKWGGESKGADEKWGGESVTPQPQPQAQQAQPDTDTPRQSTTFSQHDTQTQ